MLEFFVGWRHQKLILSENLSKSNELNCRTFRWFMARSVFLLVLWCVHHMLQHFLAFAYNGLVIQCYRDFWSIDGIRFLKFKKNEQIQRLNPLESMYGYVWYKYICHVLWLPGTQMTLVLGGLTFKNKCHWGSRYMDPKGIGVTWCNAKCRGIFWLGEELGNFPRGRCNYVNWSFASCHFQGWFFRVAKLPFCEICSEGT